MRRPMRFAVLALLILGWGVSLATAQTPVTRPVISEEVSPVEELSAETRDGQTAIGVLRRPPGQRLSRLLRSSARPTIPRLRTALWVR